MESASAAKIGVFDIGPTTVLGRAVALRVIFCNTSQSWLLNLRDRTRKTLLKVWRMLAIALRTTWGTFNPRKPGVLLGTAVVAVLILRRYRYHFVEVEVAVRRRFWSNLMHTALTYDEWAHAAGMLEKYHWRRRDSDLYDEELVRSKLEDLRRRRLHGGVEEIVFALRTDLLRNLGNICNPELHKDRLQMPRLVQDYIGEVRANLRAVCDSDSEDFPLEEKLAFIHETRHAFGRTALLLSGGAALGAFHLGVVHTLIEHRLLPRVVAGASVGSIICSFLATRTWPELQAFFDDLPCLTFFESMGSVFAAAHRLLTRGALQEIGQLQRRLRQLIGDLTFQEAYDLSGRVLAIPVSSLRPREPHRLLTYLTSPHVVIWSAVTASCAFPGLFEAQELMAKDRAGRMVPYHLPTEVRWLGKRVPVNAHPAAGKHAEPVRPPRPRQWRDGSLESDLPMRELREMFNVNHFLVAQANPHIGPLLRLKEAARACGGYWGAKAAELAEMEFKHRCRQLQALGWDGWGLAKLFTQEWEGDITIVMPATVAQFAKIIVNPSPSELRKAIMQGRRGTWERLSAIHVHCGVELMLDECVSVLNRRRKVALRGSAPSVEERSAGAAAQVAPPPPSSALRHPGASAPAGLPTRRIPSWNCLARESSWGSLDEDGLFHDDGSSAAAGAALRAESHAGMASPGAAPLAASWNAAGGAGPATGLLGGPWGAPTHVHHWRRERAGVVRARGGNQTGLMLVPVAPAAAVAAGAHALPGGPQQALADSSDSDSGAEDPLQVWARAGGPLMRSASTGQFGQHTTAGQVGRANERDKGGAERSARGTQAAPGRHEEEPSSQEGTVAGGSRRGGGAGERREGSGRGRREGPIRVRSGSTSTPWRQGSSGAVEGEGAMTRQQEDTERGQGEKMDVLPAAGQERPSELNSRAESAEPAAASLPDDGSSMGTRHPAPAGNALRHPVAPRQSRLGAQHSTAPSSNVAITGGVNMGPAPALVDRAAADRHTGFLHSLRDHFFPSAAYHGVPVPGGVSPVLGYPTTYAATTVPIAAVAFSAPAPTYPQSSFLPLAFHTPAPPLTSAPPAAMDEEGRVFALVLGSSLHRGSSLAIEAASSPSVLDDSQPGWAGEGAEGSGRGEERPDASETHNEDGECIAAGMLSGNVQVNEEDEIGSIWNGRNSRERKAGGAHLSPPTLPASVSPCDQPISPMKQDKKAMGSDCTTQELSKVPDSSLSSFLHDAVNIAINPQPDSLSGDQQGCLNQRAFGSDVSK